MPPLKEKGEKTMWKEIWEDLYGRPLFLCTIFLAAGVAASRVFPQLLSFYPASLYLLSGFLVLAVVALVSKSFPRHYFLPVFLIIFFILGIFNFQRVFQVPGEDISNYVSPHIIVEGIVWEEPRRDNNRVTFDLKCLGIQTSEGGEKVSGKARVSLYGGGEKFSYGDRVEVSGKLSLPPQKRNPGGFDYRFHLLTREVTVLLRAGGPHQVQLIGSGEGNYLIAKSYQLKKEITNLLEENLSSREASLLKGIMLGAREEMPGELEESYRRAGMAHLLAVSGLHMGLIALLVMGFFRGLKVGDKYAWPLLFFVLIIYLFLIGFKPSAVRAVLMLFLGAGGYFFKRDKDPLTAVAFAALIILLVKPLWLFTISFQLSFMAVLALIMLTPFFESRLNFLPPTLKKIVSPTLAAQLGIMPLTAYYFYEVSLGSLLANILVLPLTGLVLGLGITGLLGIVILSPLGQLLFIVAEVLLVYMTWVAELISGLQVTYFRVNPPPVAWIFIYYLILLFLVPREEFYKGIKALNLSQINTCLNGYGDKALKLCLVIILLMVWLPAWQGQALMTVVFLDVGQGDSIFINTSSGQNILIDAGGRPLFQQQEEYDYISDYVGERVVVPFLRHQGVRELDLVILSHPHEDHYGGLLSVIDHFPVKIMAAPPVEREVPLYQELMSLVEEKKIPLLYLGSGDRLKVGRDYLIDFYNPPEILFQGTPSDINENSLVFKLTRGDISFLFTGDAESRAENYMLDSGYPLKSQVLKVGHHGSNTSTGESFLEAVDPVISIIQVGQNTFGHPSPQTMDRLEEKGVLIYRTDEKGAVTVTTNGENINIKTFINQN